MTTRTQGKPWDFSHVLDLVNSLSPGGHATSDGNDDAEPDSGYTSAKSADSSGNISTQDFSTPSAKLGDFARIWQFLGTPQDSPVPAVPPLTSEPPAAGTTNFASKLDYTSDGALYAPATVAKSKGVTWKDEVSADEPLTDTVTDRSASPETPTLTKTQRKKQRRKERKAKEAAEALKNATVSESEADSIKKKTPARKASAHTPVTEPPKRYNLRPRDASGECATTPGLQPSIELATSRVAEQLAAIKSSPPKSQAPAPPSTPSRPAPRHQWQHTKASPSVQRTTSTQNVNFTDRRPQQTHTAVQEWPVTPSIAKTTKLVPSSVQPPSQHAASSIMVNKAAVANNQNTPPTSKPKHVIEPKIVRSGEDRHWALLMKLIGDFWEDRKHLISPMNLTNHSNNPKGIHVFVDASNIFIGFTDQLKRSRGIPPYVQVPQVDLSFDGLALLMERRRPVCKRVLVGSTPHLAAFDKAEAVGYECNILEKVYKARELTERQIYFNTHDRYGRPISKGGAKAPPANSVLSTSPTANGSISGSGGNGSSSETGNAPQYAPARMIEQGVDEILHLKILESVVDTEVPSTIVLATGDAAQAEYSAGFMAMVERALKKGWTVELVSWSKNISMMYSRREWAETWGEKFRVVYLDDYAEELLEM